MSDSEQVSAVGETTLPEKVETTEQQFTNIAQKPSVRKDWYQTDTYVTISLLIKQCKSQHVNISYQENHIGGKIEIPSGGTYELDLNLSHPIDITQCKTRILQSKIEIKLKKKDAIHWTVLELENVQENVKAIPAETKSQETDDTNTAHQYPSSRHVVKDWDRLAAEITKNDDDKEEGEAALNALFQKIYGEGGDQVKKAMNKSFVESGGTVLSTNWDEVSKAKVDRKPPDGMEWKNWEK
ncbi:protein SGT1 homolog [Exaiptasia diaphana]|uniref:Suppressor of G2 allele of SKP1 n=1 Tax=Exaiptasia diaphana TaxID=2652724 RepID=A0A913WP97_EXADI|nr:protein SGT1 homolog [Exaiptasia diaphana]KXJ19061.1 Suppressor of G2 allele of SKP1-like [Exaiptasia diaphana]